MQTGLLGQLEITFYTAYSIQEKPYNWMKKGICDVIKLCYGWPSLLINLMVDNDYSFIFVNPRQHPFLNYALSKYEICRVTYK